jgi:hypothetical protein
MIKDTKAYFENEESSSLILNDNYTSVNINEGILRSHVETIRL